MANFRSLKINKMSTSSLNNNNKKKTKINKDKISSNNGSVVMKIKNDGSENGGPHYRFIDETAEEESSDDEPESESEDETRFVNDETPELPSEFWQLQKLIKYTKAGNQTATTVALCLLKNYQLNSRVIIILLSMNK